MEITMLRTLLSAFLIVLLSCTPLNPPKESTRSKDNQASINELKHTIKELNEKVAEIETKSKASHGGSLDQEEVQQMKDEIQSLRAELFEHITQLEQKINQRLAQYEDKYKELETLIHDQNEKFVSIEEFQKAKIKIERELQSKAYYLEARTKQKDLSSEEMHVIQIQIAELRSKQAELETSFTESLSLASQDWNQKLQQKLSESNNELTSEIRDFIAQEITRIQTSNEGVTNKLARLEAELEQLKKSETPERFDILRSQIIILNKQIQQNKQLLAQIKQQEDEIKHHTSPLRTKTGIVTDIMTKLYAPCTTGGLKKDKFCFSVGTVINRLGGQFLDPTKFDRNKKDLLTYLVQSGVTSKAATKKIDSYIVPGSSRNKEIFNKCHSTEEIKALIAPQKYWPRLVILTLLFQSMEKNIHIEKDLGLISNKVNPSTYFVAWWRSQCYSDGLKGKKNTRGDHLFASALDIGFADQANNETFEYYRNYIETHIWDNDIYEIVYPLQNSGLKISVGVGLGHGSHHKGQMHLGIYSEIAEPNDNRRQWTYGSYTDLF